MKLKIGQILTLNDKDDYVVVDIAIYHGITYAYLANMESKEEEIIFRRVINTKEGYDLYPLADTKEYQTITEVFFNRNKNLFKEN